MDCMSYSIDRNPFSNLMSGEKQEGGKRGRGGLLSLSDNCITCCLQCLCNEEALQYDEVVITRPRVKDVLVSKNIYNCEIN